MAELQSTFKLDVSAGITSSVNNGIICNPDKFSIEFTVQAKLEKSFAMAPGEIKVIDLVAEGFGNGTDVLMIQGLTVNKPFLLGFDDNPGAIPRTPYVPVTTTAKPFYLGTPNLLAPNGKITLENPDTVAQIWISLKAYKRAD